MITLSSLVRIVRLRWRTFVTVVAACAVLAFLAALIAPNRYVSSVQLLVTAKGSSTAQSYQNMEIETARATSYLALLRSHVVDQRVVDELHLTYGAQTLSDRINAALVPKTTIIDVQVTGDTADQARRAADSLSRQFVAYTAALEEPTGTDNQRVQTTVIASASDPTRERPGAWLFGLLGSLVGIVLGTAGAWIRSRTDPVVRVPADAASATNGLPLLGDLCDGSDPAGATESTRALHARLTAVHAAPCVWHAIVVADHVNFMLLTTSFARAVSSPGERVAVVATDASTSKPTREGSHEVVHGEAGLDEVVGNIDDPTTDTVFAGVEDSRDGMPEKSIQSIVDNLRAHRSVIVIGSRSVRIAAAEASASESSDATVLIAVEGATRRPDLTAVDAGLRMLGTTAAGIVFAGRQSGESRNSIGTTEVTEDAPPVGSGRA